MREKVVLGILVVCVTTAIIGAALGNKSDDIDLDTYERALKDEYAELLEARKQWMKDIFRYHDKAALTHIFFPFVFTGLFNSVVWGILWAYFYESAVFVWDIYRPGSPHFTRMPDSLVQDPMQAAIGAAAIMLMWKGKHLERMSELAQKNKWKCVFVTIGTLSGDLGLNMAPADRAIYRFPACVFIVWLGVKWAGGKTSKVDTAAATTSFIIMLTGWLPLVLAHGVSYYAMTWKWVDPFQSTVWWAVSLLAFTAVINPRKRWEDPRPPSDDQRLIHRQAKASVALRL